MSERAGRTKNKHGAVEMFVPVILLVFAFMALFACVLGVGAYKKVVSDSVGDANRRNTLLYISGKLKANDRSGAVSVEHSTGGDILMLSDTISGEGYITYIFCAEGELREYFSKSDLSFDSGLGNRVAECESLSVRIDGGLYDIEVKTETGISGIFVCLSSEEDVR